MKPLGFNRGDLLAQSDRLGLDPRDNDTRGSFASDLRRALGQRDRLA